MIPDRLALQQIARRAMQDRGFEPDYPPAVLDQVARLPNTTVLSDGRRDLRALAWASMDADAVYRTGAGLKR